MKYLVSFLFVANCFSMQEPSRPYGLPCVVENKSNYVVTLVQRNSRSHLLRQGQQFPDPECSFGSLVLVAHHDISIATSQGHFSLMLENQDSTFGLLFAINDAPYWKTIKEFPLAAITKITARVQSNGMIKLIQHKHSPQDGRPDVSLLAYEELLGAQVFATAEQILGIMPGQNPDEAYHQQIAKYCNIYVHYSEAESIKQLIGWAGQKLGVVKP